MPFEDEWWRNACQWFEYYSKRKGVDMLSDMLDSGTPFEPVKNEDMAEFDWFIDRLHEGKSVEEILKEADKVWGRVEG